MILKTGLRSGRNPNPDPKGLMEEQWSYNQQTIYPSSDSRWRPTPPPPPPPPYPYYYTCDHCNGTNDGRGGLVKAVCNSCW